MFIFQELSGQEVIIGFKSQKEKETYLAMK